MLFNQNESVLNPQTTAMNKNEMLVAAQKQSSCPRLYASRREFHPIMGYSSADEMQLPRINQSKGVSIPQVTAIDNSEMLVATPQFEVMQDLTDLRKTLHIKERDTSHGRIITGTLWGL